MRHAWIDASAGVAGDMLLGALIDAGAQVDVVRAAVDAVLPGAAEITVEPVLRAGLRAVRARVAALVDDPPHRTWRDIRELLDRATLTDPVRDRARTVFATLAEAEAYVHAVSPDDVHFHEVGALDSVADVVGVCVALGELGVQTVSAGEVAVGSGRVRTAHGELPVPVPAVAYLARGWRIRAGGAGELATPTGMALLRALAVTCQDLPSMALEAVGSGAGARDTPGRANVVRVHVGTTDRGTTDQADTLVQLEANVDDLDPRLWPGVLAGLLDAGAADAWLVPILMKKGRPAHTVVALCHLGRAVAVRERIFRDTTTLGVREVPVRRTALPRAFVDVSVAGGTVAVKVAHRDGVIVQVMPEFTDVAELARRLARPSRAMLAEATAAAAAAGLVLGAPLPAQVRPV